ncbi:potassium-efflux system protein KefB (nonfunctional) [Aeromonas salmonicida subsp. pectinolytica 34mel]|uniref:Potassium-efflux system protein KefB (Nonfunctional) n=1 Tax=Aeromonas salmonicida subsp. pectinolytica 34mel TaxID=1324960 RepID=T0PLR7_AERSA|nr:potassium-efflux system protein KefB (nonfunctional) [Aeromonas salmonicida subsp. pectinolytica 34mel]EQC04982.1 Kef-type K+ transport system membrane protein [Aeromonas salmonicida subsp. pectinolytica 34mel]
MYADVLILLFAAVLLVAIFRRFGQPVIRRMELERSSQYRFLHGFYWGDQSASNLETDQLLERLHPVLLHDQAWAVGQTVQALALDAVRIKEVQRGEQSLEPRPELRLAAGDRLVLFGNAVAMEQAEQKLLEGR